MASQVHITANYDKRARINPKDHVEVYRALKDEIDHMKDQTNLLKRQVAQGSQSVTSSLTERVVNAGAGGGSSSKDIVVTTQTLLSGVPVTITFAVPGLLIGLPDCYAIQEGIFALVGYSFTANEPIGFSITPSADCTLKFGYRPL